MTKVRSVKIEGVKVPRGVTHVCSLMICGVNVPVFRATPRLMPEFKKNPDGSHVAGYFDSEKSAIFLRDGAPPTTERNTTVHEALHAFWFLSGLDQAIRTSPKREMDETFAHVGAPHIVALLDTMHGFRWPR